MSTPEALILAALAVFALAAVWTCEYERQARRRARQARRSIREFDRHTREALRLVQR